MKKTLIPFDGEFKEVPKTIIVPGRVDIKFVEKSLVEANFCSNQ